jgi:glutaredoxin
VTPKRILGCIVLALLPALALALAFPERAWKTSPLPERYLSTQGASLVAFVRDGCPHCAAFEAFAGKEGWAVEYHEVTELGTPELFAALQEHAPLLQQGVPTIVIDGKIFQGYETDITTGLLLKHAYAECLESGDGCLPFRDFLASEERNVEVLTATNATCTQHCKEDMGKYTLNLWFIGPVDLITLSLPMLSILLGFLDGFNPCAMWVLITLLTLLINTHNMRKVWVIGGTFLFVSAIVYYLFIAAWLNVFLLIGYNAWVQKIIGLIALAGGGFYLAEALGKDPNQCKVSNLSARQKTIARMKAIMSYSAWPAMILGVAVLAVSVNMIELVCTAGLPAVFTQILALNNVPDLARYGYIGLYILLYMIDDLAIFAVAVFTLHATGFTTKYKRFTLIFGGALMYVLGLLLIFAPEALTFH